MFKNKHLNVTVNQWRPQRIKVACNIKEESRKMNLNEAWVFSLSIKLAGWVFL